MNTLFLCLLELQMIIILHDFSGNFTALKISHDLSFKKKNNDILAVHVVLRGFLSERGQINKITCGQ